MRCFFAALGLALVFGSGVCAPEPGPAAQTAPEHTVPEQSAMERTLRQNAAEGDAEAQYRLALALLKPIPPHSGLVKEGAEAAEWLQKSAEQGNMDAAFMLGYILQYGTGVAKNVGLALPWLTKAAESGHVSAMITLATVYKVGDGVIKDKIKTRDYYAKAAEKGNNNARMALGVMYRDGDGVHKDAKLALGWLKHAIKDGHGPSMLALGRVYAQEDSGMLNGPKAVYWTHQAVAHGYAPGIYALGLLYRDGVGSMEPDAFKAYLWLRLAYELSNKVSGPSEEKPYWLENAERALTSQQRKKADKEIAGWLRKGPPAPPAKEPQ